MLLTEHHRDKGSGLVPWPARLTSPPPRLIDLGYAAENFEMDMVILLFFYHYFNYVLYVSLTLLALHA